MASGIVKWFNEKKDVDSLKMMKGGIYLSISPILAGLDSKLLLKVTG